MEYCNGRLCISTRELFDGGIVTEANYRNWTNRNRVEVVRRGGGARGRYALIAIDSLPPKYAKRINHITSPFVKWFESNFRINQHAIEYCGEPKLCGFHLTVEKAFNLAINASILDLFLKIYTDATLTNLLFGEKIEWSIVCAFLRSNRSKYNHTLPISEMRLKNKLKLYKRFGFRSLFSQKFGNQNAKKK